MSHPDTPELPPKLLAHIEQLKRSGPFICSGCEAAATHIGVVPLPDGKYAVLSVCRRCKEQSATFPTLEELLTLWEAAERN